MCRRYNIDIKMPEIHSILEDINHKRRGVTVVAGDKDPSQIVPVIEGAPEELSFGTALWGIGGKWNGQDEDLVYNVCAEHVLEERRYRRDLLHHPVAFPASCFYEWKVLSKNIVNQYKCHNTGNSPVYLAGFYKEYQDKDGALRKRAAILTTISNKYMMPYQYRMPVLLKEREVQAWLQGSYVQYFLNRCPFYVEVETVYSGISPAAGG